MIWRIVLLFLSYWILAAHFLRYDGIVPTAIVALMPLLIIVRHRAAVYLLQAGLIVGVVAVWIPTTINIAQFRISMGDPWLRMSLIMSAVMLFNLITVWCMSALYKK